MKPARNAREGAVISAEEMRQKMVPCKELHRHIKFRYPFCLKCTIYVWGENRSSRKKGGTGTSSAVAGDFFEKMDYVYNYM